MKVCPRLFRFSLVVAVLFVTGCSFSYIYRQLDWLVPWYVSDYITLDEQQQTELERRLLSQLDWHCSTQLQRYADWMLRLHDSPDAFTREHLEQHYETTRVFWRDLMTRLTADAATILSDASDAQVAELVKNLERKQNERDREEASLTPELRMRRRIERMTRLLERWIGELSAAQKQRVADWSSAMERMPDGSISARHSWQQQFVQTLATRKDKKEFALRLHTLLVEPETFWSESYRLESRQRRERTLDMLAGIASVMTAVQRGHLQHQLSSWIDELQSLACEPGHKNGSER